MNWDKINAEMERNRALIIDGVVSSALSKDRRHSHFWVEDGGLAWTSFDGAMRKINKSWVGANAKNGTKRIHPTEKPVYLYGWILNKYCKDGFKVLDTHLGSGSIALACNMYKVDLVACEIDKKYFDNAKKRLEIEQTQQSLF